MSLHLKALKGRKKTVDGNEIHFVYDLNGNVLAEYNVAEASLLRNYIYGVQGELVYMHLPRTVEMNDELDNFIEFVTAWLCNPLCDSNDLVWDDNNDLQVNLIDWAANTEYFDEAFRTNGRYVLADFRNSVIGMTDPNNDIIEISYNAFGTPIVAQGTDLEGLSVLWNGYYFDNETGNYYLRNRYYSPLERRFLTEDPHGVNPDGNWNNRFSIKDQYRDGRGLQVYAGGDPVNNRDDWGLFRRNLRLKNCGRCGRCGPDVTAQVYAMLKRTRIKLNEEFKTPGRKEEICDGIYSMNGWDMGIWGSISKKDSNGRRWPKHKPCDDTVTFKGNCVKKWELNYLLWGFLNRKCGITSKFNGYTNVYTTCKAPFCPEDAHCKRSFAWFGRYGSSVDSSCYLNKCCKTSGTPVWNNMIHAYYAEEIAPSKQ